MSRIVREARIGWEGDVAAGGGVVGGASSGAFEALPFTGASRAGATDGATSPEELLAAAHGACFTMALASELSRAGTPPGRLDVRCVVTLDEVEGKGHQIVHSELDARGSVAGCDAAAFAQAAEAAEASCAFSALIRASATVNVTATLL